MAASIRASKEGLDLVDKARRKKGWAKTAEAWVGLAHTSTATLKRFWLGMPVQFDTFQSICMAVGIDDWKKVSDIPEEKKIDPKRRRQVMLSLDIDLERLDDEKLQKIIADFMSLGGDQSIKLMDVDEG